MELYAILTCDPPGVTRAAGLLGRLAGRGLVPLETCLAALSDAAAAAAPGRDAAGMRIRLGHAVADAADAEQRRRQTARLAVASVLRAGLRAGLGSAELRSRAASANRGALDTAELAAFAARQVARALGQCG